ncbi:hypothetical protein U1Q18_006632 [Sarracenia purpurea var. burkii]
MFLKSPQAMMISNSSTAASSSSPLQSSFTKWHKRLGHLSIKKLRVFTSKHPLSNKELFSNTVVVKPTVLTQQISSAKLGVNS